MARLMGLETVILCLLVSSGGPLRPLWLGFVFWRLVVDGHGWHWFGTERYSMIGWGLGLGILETRCVCSKLIVPILGFSILLAIIPENMVFCILPYQFIFLFSCLWLRWKV